MKRKELLILLLLTFGALLIHGYHPWAEDSEVYVAGVEKTLHPELFPFNSQFFASHASSTLFPTLVAASVRLSHLPLSVVLFVWHLASIYLFLLACWQLVSRCFPGSNARWAGVALIAALLTLPVAGTALYILDQYLNPRNLAAFSTIFAIVKMIDRKYFQAGLFLAFTVAVHPLMAVFAFSYLRPAACARPSGYGFRHSRLPAALRPFTRSPLCGLPSGGPDTWFSLRHSLELVRMAGNLGAPRHPMVVQSAGALKTPAKLGSPVPRFNHLRTDLPAPGGGALHGYTP